MVRWFNVRVSRYWFCFLVNEKSLQGVLRAPIDNCMHKYAFVNILYGWWKPKSVEDFSQEDLEDVDQPEELLDDGDDPVEGYTLKDVG